MAVFLLLLEDNVYLIIFRTLPLENTVTARVVSPQP